MKKFFIILLMLSLLPVMSALGDRWDLVFSDGTTTINGTDVCLADGTCLSNVSGGGGTGDITAVNAIAPYILGGGTSGSVDIDFNDTLLNLTITNIASGFGGNSSWNESYANTLYASIGSGNASWNQTYANTLYILVGDEGNLNVNSSDYWDNYNTTNSTWFENVAGVLGLKLTELTSWTNTWFGTKTSDDLTEGTTNLYDNQSWNQTFATTLYADISITGDNASWNQTFADTLYYDLGNSLGYYNSTDFVITDYYLNSNPANYWNDTFATFNKSYADTLYAAFGAGNSSWNESYADTLYANISVINNNTNILDDNLYNTTQFENQGGSLHLLTSWLDTWFTTKGVVNGTDGADGANGINGTDGADGINGTTPVYGVDYINGTDGADGINGINGTDGADGINGINGTDGADGINGTTPVYGVDYINGTDGADGANGVNGTDGTDGINGTNLFTSINETQFDNSTGVLNIVEEWLNGLFDTWLGTKDTDDLTEGSANSYDNKSWNQTFADTLYAAFGSGNSSWNETYASTLYYDLGNSNSYWNDTYATFNKSYADTLYAAIGDAGNSSWNESYASTLYIQNDSMAILTQLNVSDHFRINTVNITCFNADCTWYTNATDNCLYWESGGKDCGAA